jgi:transcription elongation factor Elf1
LRPTNPIIKGQAMNCDACKKKLTVFKENRLGIVFLMMRCPSCGYLYEESMNSIWSRMDKYRKVKKIKERLAREKEEKEKNG